MSRAGPRRRRSSPLRHGRKPHGSAPWQAAPGSTPGLPSRRPQPCQHSHRTPEVPAQGPAGSTAEPRRLPDELQRDCGPHAGQPAPRMPTGPATAVTATTQEGRGGGETPGANLAPGGRAPGLRPLCNPRPSRGRGGWAALIHGDAAVTAAWDVAQRHSDCSADRHQSLPDAFHRILSLGPRGHRPHLTGEQTQAESSRTHRPPEPEGVTPALGPVCHCRGQW